MDKKEIIKKFIENIKKNDSNTIDITEEGYGDELKERFTVLCNNCGSDDIELLIEQGVDYGGMTGYSPGQSFFKCKECGNAISWFA